LSVSSIYFKVSKPWIDGNFPKISSVAIIKKLETLKKEWSRTLKDRARYTAEVEQEVTGRLRRTFNLAPVDFVQKIKEDATISTADQDAKITCL
jgi:hypothetical protein